MRSIAPTVMMILALAWAAPAMGSGTRESAPETATSMGMGEGSEAGAPIESRQTSDTSAGSATGQWLSGKVRGWLILLGLAILPIALRKRE
jgi:hypothetical protein